MSGDQKDNTSAVRPLVDADESYWSALLEEGEFSGGGQGMYEPGWDAFGAPTALHSDFASNQTSDQDWTLAQHTYDNDETVELNVTGYNRGGLLVAWNSLRGFVPASQLVDFPVDIDEMTRRDMLATRVNQQLRLRIIELDSATNRLILSERAAQVQPGQRASILGTLHAGTNVDGVVTNLCDFGAFVDLGGVEGLIHISELSWGRVAHPRDILQSGQKVKVYIMTVDTEEERIALSLKRLQPDPWASVDQRYKVGQLVEGTVTNVVDFGAFACIEQGLEGLIHISELAEGQFLHPRAVVQENTRVTARILNIDGPNRRLGLSLRGVQQANGNGVVAPTE
jgi:small subunit ribosomal protein S1